MGRDSPCSASVFSGLKGRSGPSAIPCRRPGRGPRCGRRGSRRTSPAAATARTERRCPGGCPAIRTGRRSRSYGVDHHDAATAFDDRMHAFPHPRRRDQAAVRDDQGWLPSRQASRCGTGPGTARTSDSRRAAGWPSAAGGVLGGGGVRWDRRPRAVRKRATAGWVVAEGARVAGVPADGRRTVPIVDVAEPFGDIGECLVPADFLPKPPSAAAAAER